MDQIERLRRELCGLCEETEDSLHETAQGDTLEAAYARGRRHEAKGIRRAMGEVFLEERRAAIEVWLCLCVAPDREEQTFAFSSYEKATLFADNDRDRAHVVYPRVLDHPELVEMVTQ